MSDTQVLTREPTGREWIPPCEAAERLGVDVVAIYQMLLDGQLSGARDLDRRILVSAPDVERLV
jgi:hypothetical protein